MNHAPRDDHLRRDYDEPDSLRPGIWSRLVGRVERHGLCRSGTHAAARIDHRVVSARGRASGPQVQLSRRASRRPHPGRSHRSDQGGRPIRPVARHSLHQLRLPDHPRRDQTTLPRHDLGRTRATRAARGPGTPRHDHGNPGRSTTAGTDHRRLGDRAGHQHHRGRRVAAGRRGVPAVVPTSTLLRGGGALAPRRDRWQRSRLRQRRPATHAADAAHRVARTRSTHPATALRPNLLVGGDDVRVIDFGISRYIGQMCGHGGVVQCSPGWAAPEQLRGIEATLRWTCSRGGLSWRTWPAGCTRSRATAATNGFCGSSRPNPTCATCRQTLPDSSGRHWPATQETGRPPPRSPPSVDRRRTLRRSCAFRPYRRHDPRHPDRNRLPRVQPVGDGADDYVGTGRQHGGSTAAFLTRQTAIAAWMAGVCRAYSAICYEPGAVGLSAAAG